MNDEQVAKVQHEREQMSEELLGLQQKISEQINTISDLEQAHDKVNQEMEQMTLLLAARETDIANLQSRKEKGFHHIQQQLSKELTEIKVENDKLKEQIKEQALNRKELLFSDKETQTIASSNETTTIEDLQKKFELEHAASETDLHSQVSKKEETIVLLRKQVQQLTETLQLSENVECHNCSLLTEKVEDFKVKLEPLEVRVLTMETENKKLTDEVKKLQEDQVITSEVAISEKSQLQSELAKCTKELERLKTHLLQVLLIGHQESYLLSYHC